MNLQHLKYAVEIEQTGSITRAAENLFISQPSLSKAIREMETSLGFSVFERTARGMTPTRKGRELLEHAYAILRQMSEIETLTADESAKRQDVSICAPRAAYVAEALARFCVSLDTRHPMNVHLWEISSTRVLDAVSDGRFRLGIIRYHVHEEGLFMSYLKRREMRSEEIWTFRPVLLTSSSQTLLHTTAADLERAVEIRCEESSMPEDFCKRTSRAIFLHDRAMLPELLSSIPNSFAWVSPLPPAPLKRWSLSQQNAEPYPEQLCDRLVYSADIHFSPGERAFLDVLYAIKNEAVFDVNS